MPIDASRPSLLPRLAALALVLILGLACGAAPEADAPAVDEPAADAPAADAEPADESRAVEIAERALEAMGGREAWDATRYLRFNFFGFRTHHWDRATGRHRLEGKSREGEDYVILHNVSSPQGDNVSSREGEAWINGEKIEGDDLTARLNYAYGAWINDTYWLLMPYKLRDPGVELAHDGEEELDGVVYDKLKLTFEGVGLTPGDTYWAWINRDTGLMDRWAYFLEDWEEGREPTWWQWLDWQTYGGIKLSSVRKNADDQERKLNDIAVFDELPDAVFTSPEPPPAL